MEEKRFNSSGEKTQKEIEQKRIISKIRFQLMLNRNKIFQESFGGNAGKGSNGRLRAGLNAVVNRNTGEIVYMGNYAPKEQREDSNLSCVIFTYETGENFDLDVGRFVEVQETGGGSLSSEALANLKEAIKL